VLEELITSKTRLRLLIKFFINQANRGYLNGLATEMGESTNAIRKELNHLHTAGYLSKLKLNNKVVYHANTKHPLFDILKKIVFKHLGLEELVEIVLERMGSVKQIVLIGDYAKGLDSGSIELFLIGDSLNTEYINQLENKIELLINRKVNFYLSQNHPNDNHSIILYDSSLNNNA